MRRLCCLSFCLLLVLSALGGSAMAAVWAQAATGCAQGKKACHCPGTQPKAQQGRACQCPGDAPCRVSRAPARSAPLAAFGLPSWPQAPALTSPWLADWPRAVGHSLAAWVQRPPAPPPKALFLQHSSLLI